MFTDELFNESKDIWQSYLNHPFLVELSKGNLDKEKFKNYLIQDYLYLKEYAKVFCMGMIKSNSLKEMKFFYDSINGIINDETAIHIEYLNYFNVVDVENYKLNIVNESYTSYMKGVSLTGDVLEIISTILPCTWSYNFIAKNISQKCSDDNFFKKWIDSYNSDEYKNFTKLWIDFTNDLCKNIDESKKERLKEIFRKSSIYEYEFWDMAYKGDDIN
jgi:thiaminase/transcriptional activator TenA